MAYGAKTHLIERFYVNVNDGSFSFVVYVVVIIKTTSRYLTKKYVVLYNYA